MPYAIKLLFLTPCQRQLAYCATLANQVYPFIQDANILKNHCLHMYSGTQL